MKYKHIIAVFIIGYILKIVGAWAKITHQAYANAVISIAFIILIISCILLLIKVLFSKKNSSLDK
jgi:Na+/melibiose symporter-like transporter